MLSFLNWYRKSKSLRFIFSTKANPISISVNVNGFCFNGLNCLYQFKCSTVVNNDEFIRLDELNNLSLTHQNFNTEKLAVLTHEISKFKALGKNVPEYINLTDVRDILECETQSQRSRYLTYLFKKEKIKLKSKEKKLKNKIERESRHVEVLENNSHIQYGLGKNTLFLRTLKRSMMKYYDKRLANAVLFGQKIVIDLGYDKLMTKKEKKACTSQIRLLYSFNRLNHDPYDLYICNANPENRCVEYLRHDMPNLDESFATVTEQSYLDLFPKESLVYLSPHASETLRTYDYKAVYIIGGFVDTVKRENVSSFKAEEEGIRSCRLPLDEFVAWGIGSKSLAINQVFSILQTMRDTGDWKEAFKHLPTRKLKKIDSNSDVAELYFDKLCVISNN